MLRRPVDVVASQISRSRVIPLRSRTFKNFQAPGIAGPGSQVEI